MSEVWSLRVASCCLVLPACPSVRYWGALVRLSLTAWSYPAHHRLPAAVIATSYQHSHHPQTNIRHSQASPPVNRQEMIVDCAMCNCLNSKRYGCAKANLSILDIVIVSSVL